MAVLIEMSHVYQLSSTLGHLIGWGYEGSTVHCGLFADKDDEYRSGVGCKGRFLLPLNRPNGPGLRAL